MTSLFNPVKKNEKNEIQKNFIKTVSYNNYAKNIPIPYNKTSEKNLTSAPSKNSTQKVINYKVTKSATTVKTQSKNTDFLTNRTLTTIDNENSEYRDRDESIVKDVSEINKSILNTSELRNVSEFHTDVKKVSSIYLFNL